MPITIVMIIMITKILIIMIINLRMNKAERSPKTLTRPKS